MPASRASVSLGLLTASLSAAWLLWSGIYKPMLLGLGAFSVALVVWLVCRAETVDKGPVAPRHWRRLPGFWLWLLREVYVSSSRVARLVLSPRLAISPTTVEIEALPKTRLGQATLGNSITLTPGTVTLDVFEGKLLLHALTREDAEAVAAGEMNRRVAHCLEG